MALIKCPDCGREVSDKAKNCINCGCPLAGINPAGPVSVALNGNAIVKMYIFNMETGEELWCGSNGEVAQFNVEKETEISVIDIWQKKHPEKGTKAVVRGGKRYEYKWVQDLFHIKFVINEIDIIDSGR